MFVFPSYRLASSSFWVLWPIFCCYLMMMLLWQNEAHPVDTHTLLHSEPLACLSGAFTTPRFRSGKSLRGKEKVFAGKKKKNKNRKHSPLKKAPMLLHVFFHIHLYPQTQGTEPILIRPCRLLSPPYWRVNTATVIRKRERAARIKTVSSRTALHWNISRCFNNC